MQNLTNPAWIKGKGILFLLLGLLSAALLFFERPTLRVAVLLLVVVWSFCRFYYFAFYVLYCALFRLNREVFDAPRFNLAGA